MNLTKERVKEVILKKGYKWFDDKPNLIGIRTALQVPDLFNDPLLIVYKVQPVPTTLSDLDKQKWLNTYYKETVLKEDGNFGPKSQAALLEYNKTVGTEKLFTSIITTEPGTTYQKRLLNEGGCWVMMPAQMIDAYTSGFHQGKPDHRCLRSTGKIYGLREDDKDGIVLNDKDAKAEWVDGTKIGANIHGALHKDARDEFKAIDLTTKVGPWSAGCQVHERWSKKEEMMDIVDSYGKIKITYTLLEEIDFV